jgi:hypothetical protein
MGLKSWQEISGNGVVAFSDLILMCGMMEGKARM